MMGGEKDSTLVNQSQHSKPSTRVILFNTLAVATQLLNASSPKNKSQESPAFQAHTSESVDLTLGNSLAAIPRHQSNENSIPLDMGQTISLDNYETEPFVEGPLANLTQVENGVNFNFSDSPQQDFIEYAFAVNQIVNEFKPTLTNRTSQAKAAEFSKFITESLSTLGYQEITDSPQYKLSIQSLENNDELDIQAIFGVARDKFAGAPLSKANENPIEYTHTLLSTDSHKLSPAGGEVIRFQNDWADITGLKGGDTFYLKYPQSQGKPESNHTGVILATSQLTETSEPVVLVAHANRFVNEQGLLVKDGQMRIEWMNQTRFDEQFKEKGSQMAVERPFGMGVVSSEANQELLNSYVKHKTEIATGQPLSSQSEILEFLAETVAVGRHTDEDLASFVQANFATGISPQINEASLNHYQKNVEAYDLQNGDIREVPGFAEVSLSLNILRNGNSPYVISIKALNDFSVFFQNNHFTIDKLVNDKVNWDIERGFEWHTDLQAKDLLVGDLVFIPNGSSRGNNVGIVVDEQIDDYGVNSGSTVLFFNQDGTPNVVKLQSQDNKFIDSLGKPYENFGVLRGSAVKNRVAISNYLRTVEYSRNNEGNIYLTPQESYSLVGQIIAASEVYSTPSDRNKFIEDNLLQFYAINSENFGEVKLDPETRDTWVELSKHRSNDLNKIENDLTVMPGYAETVLAANMTSYYVHSITSASGREIRELSTYMNEKGLTLTQLFEHPTNIKLDNLKVKTTSSLDDLYQDDIIITKPNGDLPPSVGIVTESWYQGQDKYISLIFYRQDGTNHVASYYVDKWNKIKDVNGEPYQAFAILRTSYSNSEYDVYRQAREYLKTSAEVPLEISHMILGRHINYEQIPVITELRAKLRAAQTPAERYQIMLEMTSYLGVQTKDEAEYQDGWVWKEDDRYKCNLYSVEWMRMMGFEKYISHWESGGKPIDKGGRELSAFGMYEFMNNHGEENGWLAADQLTYKQRLKLLESGYVFYGVNGHHTWVIYGGVNSDGEIVPVLTQATQNFMSVFAFETGKFASPADEGVKGNVLWARPLPGVPAFDFSQFEHSTDSRHGGLQK